MDVFDQDLLNFWRELGLASVNYIMVGGVATNLNGYSRTTDDIDIWIEDTRENRGNFRKAFNAYSGLDLFMMETLQIVPGWTSFNLNQGMRLDLLTSMKGLEALSFKECREKAYIAEIDDVRVPFLHINHLIANKKAVNRPQDQLDVIYLEKIKKMEENRGSGI